MKTAKSIFFFALVLAFSATLFAMTAFASADSITTYQDSNLATASTFFKDGATVYFQVNYATGYAGGIKNATVTDATNPLNKINVLMFDDGTGPHDAANDGKYTGSFTTSGDTTNDTTDNLNLAPGTGTNATITADNTAASAPITADYIAPSVTIITPTAGTYGATLSVSVNATEAISKISSASFWFSNTTNTSVYSLSCSLVGSNYVCSATFSTASISSATYTFWVTVTDGAKNTGYSSRSGIVIANQAPVISIDFTHPTNQKWFVNTSDLFTITGNVTNASGAIIPANLTFTLSLPGKSAMIQNISYTSGQFTPDFEFTNANVGDGTITVTATDALNNTASASRTIYVTSFVDRVEVSLKTPKDYWNKWDEPIFVIIAKSSSGKAVYKANVTISIQDVQLVDTGETDSSGKLEYTFRITANRRTFTVDVSASSPLNSSKTVTNSTILKSAYIDITFWWEKDFITLGDNLTVFGHLEASFENQTFVQEKSVVKYFIFIGTNESNKNNTIKDATTLKTDEWGNFTFSFIPQNLTTHYIRVNASVPWEYEEGKTFTVISTAVKELEVFNASELGILSYGLRFNMSSLATVEQGNTTETNLTITNLGTRDLSTFRTTFTAKTLAARNWYSVKGLPTFLASGDEAKVRMNFSIGVDINVSDYPVTLNITTKEGASGSIKFTLRVIPGAALRKTINSTVNGFKADMTRVGENIAYLSKNVKTAEVEVLLKKFQQASELYANATSAIQNKDWFSAYQAQQQLSDMLPLLEAGVEAQITAYQGGTNTRNLIIVAIIVIVIITILIWYLWLPPPSYRYKPSKPILKKENIFEKMLHFARISSLRSKIRKVLRRSS